MKSILVRAVVLLAALAAAAGPAFAQTKSQKPKPKPQPAFVWGGFPKPNATGTAQQRQTMTGVQQITCPPPARPSCGSSR